MSCILDCDQTFTVHDFGPRGHSGHVSVNLNHGLQTGGMISAVMLTDHEMFVNVKDVHKNVLFSFAARLYKGQLACNALIDGKWGTEMTTEKSSWQKGMRASFGLLYDAEGFRVYVNGESALFLEHRSKNRPSILEISSGTVFKIIYHTTMKIVP